MSPNEYCSLLRKATGQFEDYGLTKSIEFEEEIRAGKQIVIAVKIVLLDHSVLIIREFIDAKYKIEKLSYAYQYHAENGELIFRYDNAAHKPSLGYKEHKHLSSGEIIHAPLPDIFDVLDEVLKYL